MTKAEYEIYLVTKVDWWLYNRAVGDYRSNQPVVCYHGDVFGVRTIMEFDDLAAIAEKHGQLLHPSAKALWMELVTY